MSKSQLLCSMCESCNYKYCDCGCNDTDTDAEKQVDHEALPEEDQKILYEKL